MNPELLRQISKAGFGFSAACLLGLAITHKINRVRSS
jgi:hypothetical protein